MMRQLEPAAFRAWLEAQPRSRCIGVAQSETACPLAHYLGDGVRLNTDRMEGWTYTGRLLPSWAIRFAMLVDALPSPGPHRRRVYPAAALALLDEALATPEPEEAP